MAIAYPVSDRAVLTPANVVTMARMVLAPVVVTIIAFYAPSWWVLAFAFCSMMTDKLDGILARRYGTSRLGTFLDPLADKVIVLGSMFVLVGKGWVWWLPVAVITARELSMSWWRSRLARRGVSVPARELAKYKTWAQSMVVAFALVPGVVDNVRWLVTSTLWLAVALTLYTFLQYMRDGARESASGANQ